MRSLILIAALVVSAAHASKQQDTPLKVLQRIEQLLIYERKQIEQDRDELYAQERCYKACRSRFGDWDDEDTQDRSDARKACFRKCSDMPSPPGNY